MECATLKACISDPALDLAAALLRALHRQMQCCGQLYCVKANLCSSVDGVMQVVHAINCRTHAKLHK